MSDEAAILRSVLDGDVQAFREIVERYQGPVFRLVRNLLGPGPDAEDVAQEAFLAAFQHLASFDARRGSLAAWLFTIARHKCLTALRRRGRFVSEEAPEPVDARSPAAPLVEQEWMQAFDAALAALPLTQRTAFALAEIEGLTYEEIARVEGVKLGTIKSRIGRAKEKLRLLLQREVTQS